MALSTLQFNDLVTKQATAIQASSASKTPVDLTVGSLLRAFLEAVAAVGLWIQGLILQVFQMSRLSTSTGTDCDSFGTDFGFARLAATYATGSITFSRFTTTQQALVPVGAQAQTQDTTQLFTVGIDTTNTAYSAALAGYIIPAGVTSVTVPVVAVNPGTVANVDAGAITSLVQGIAYVDTVTNAAAFTNALDTETDAAFRTRFQLYIGSLRAATKVAVQSAIAGVQQGIIQTYAENQDYNGATDYGFFYVVIDDGSGTPPSTLLTSVANAIESTRATTIRYAVFAPIVETVTVAMTLTTSASYTHSVVVATVVTALQNFINTLTLGTSLPYSRLAQVAYDASPGVTNVTAVLLNGGTADVTATNQQVIKAGTITVT